MTNLFVNRSISSFCKSRQECIIPVFLKFLIKLLLALHLPFIFQHSARLLPAICQILVQERLLTTEALHVLLITLYDLLSVSDEHVICETCHETTRVLVAIWHRKFSDPIVALDIRDCFSSLLKKGGDNGRAQMVQGFLPTLLNVLQNTDPSSPIACVIPTALTILRVISLLLE